MGVGRGGQGGRGLPWIFIHGIDIGDRGLKVLSFGLFCYSLAFFPLPPPPEEA